MIWVLIGIVLLLLLGVVSMTQRLGELSRRIRKAEQLRSKLSGALLDLKSETDFSQAFQSGEAASLAKRAAEGAAALNRDFADANRRLDRERKTGRFAPTLTHMVELAEVIETYEDVEKRLAPLQQEVKRLGSLLTEASGEVEAVRKDWGDITAHIRQSVGDSVPAAWLPRWEMVDGALAQLSAETDGVKRAGKLAELRDTIDDWRGVSERLQTWADWRVNGEERQAILAASVKRLTEQGAAMTATCRELALSAADVELIRSLSAEAAASKAQAALESRLRGPLTELVNRSAQLLHLLADPQTRRTRLAELAARLQQVVESGSSADLETSFALAEQANPAWVKEHRARFEQWRANATRLLQSPVGASQPGAESHSAVGASESADEVVRADALLQAIAQGQMLRRDLEQQALAAKRAFAERGARIDALERAIANSLKRLADANLATSDEYQKWSNWQQQVVSLHTDSGAPSGATGDAPAHGDARGDARLRAWEKRVEAEEHVVDAMVASRVDVDQMLQQHLDQWERRHGGAPEPWVARRDRVQRQFETGDMTSAAWSALAMAESMADVEMWGAAPW